MDTNVSLQPVQERGWNSGLANLWRKENWLWWRKRQWLWQSLIWLVLFNGTITAMLLFLASQHPSTPGSVQATINNVITVFLNLQFSFIPLGLILLLQGAIINERQSGTAAWMLSKPITRSAFIVAKTAPIPGLLLIAIGIPDILAYLELVLFLGTPPSISISLEAAGLMLCSLLLFFSLMILVGTFFKSRVQVIAIPFVLLAFALRFLVQTLLLPHLLSDDRPFTLLAMLVMFLLSLVFLLVAGRLFAREEF